VDFVLLEFKAAREAGENVAPWPQTMVLDFAGPLSWSARGPSVFFLQAESLESGSGLGLESGLSSGSGLGVQVGSGGFRQAGSSRFRQAGSGRFRQVQAGSGRFRQVQTGSSLITTSGSKSGQLHTQPFPILSPISDATQTKPSPMLPQKQRRNTAGNAGFRNHQQFMRLRAHRLPARNKRRGRRSGGRVRLRQTPILGTTGRGA
jgi:hypothetical protein